MAANPFAEFATPTENPFAAFASPPQAAPPYFEISGVGSTGIPGPRRATDIATQFGRSAASLADVTLGGVIPGAAQYLAYPLARIGRSPEEAQVATQRLVSAIDKPFGKAFGVVGTPEYEQEAGRQIMDFIGQNFQKGAKWIAEKTGVPESDVESYLATATLTAPKVVPPVAKAIKEAAAPAIENIKTGVQMPFEPMLQARRERRSAESYAKAPQLDAIADAQRLKIALNPADVDPSVSTRFLSAAAGPRGPEALAEANKPRVTEIAKNELGLDPTTSLTSDAYTQARANLAAPYDEVRQLPTMVADETTVKGLNNLRKNDKLIGGEGVAKKVNKLIDNAIDKTQAGLTGAEILENVQNLRADAKKIYNNQNATPKQIAVADANLAIANQLESMIESNITNPKLLDQFRDARQKMARTYSYEGATDFNTGMVDVSKLARITAKDNALTGDIASLGKIAGNFPDVFSTTAASKFYDLPRLSRSGLSGASGALIGLPFGTTGSIVGMAAGSLLGEFGGGLAAKRMASPGYQAGLQLQDFRIPVNQLAAAAAPIPQNRAVVPYDPANALVRPTDIVGYTKDGTPITAAQAFSRPNFIMTRPRPEVTTGVQPTPPQLPAPSAQGTLNALRAEDARRAGVSRTLGQQAEAQQAAAETTARKPAGQGTNLVFDAAGNLVPESPAVGQVNIIGAPTSLESAVRKMHGEMVFETRSQYKKVQTGTDAQGAPIYETRQVPLTLTPAEAKKYALPTREAQAFAMTAEEKIAWDKAKADLSKVVPSLRALDDKAIAAKMLDRAWVEQTVAKAREQADKLVRQEALLAEQLANRNNLRMLAGEIEAKQKQLAKIKSDRISLMESVEQMEEGLRNPRPDVSGKQQGPKTRAAKRNALAPDNQNNLAP